MNRRRDPRFKTRFDALYSTGAEEGAGVLTEISSGGARLEHASLRPALGTRIRIYVFVQPIAPFEIQGLVARLTDTGFAVNCDVADPAVRRLVADVAALVATPAA
jgi:hypothetical protein